MVDVDRGRPADLLRRERATFAERNPLSAAAYEDGRRNLFGGVPMTWMKKNAAGFPL